MQPHSPRNLFLLFVFVTFRVVCTIAQRCSPSHAESDCRRSEFLGVGDVMPQKFLIRTAGFLASTLLLTAVSISGQQPAQRPPQAAPRGLAYDAARETVLDGTVVSYTASSAVAPLGAHVLLQTASGQVDVHLGPRGFLEGRHFSLANGDAVRVLGAPVSASGINVFLARVIQKGTQALVLRSTTGLPLGRPGSPPTGDAQAQQQGGAR